MIKKVILLLLVGLQLTLASNAFARFGFDEASSTLNLHFENYHGIGNRLKKLISYVRYYKPNNINLFWTDRGWVSAKFSDLFYFYYPATIWEYNDPRFIDDKHPKSNPLFKYVRGWGLLVAKNDFKSSKPFSIDRQYNNIPEEVIDIYDDYFGMLKPSEKVKNRMNDVKIDENVVCVQVRNHPDYERWFGGNEKLETFFEAMNEYPDDTIFYLSAMSKNIADKFYEKYPNRIIELPNKNYNSMIDATADLFILGSTKETLCSYMSTFCEVGWWLNGGKSKVKVIGNGKYFKRKADTLEIMEFIN